MNKNCLGKLHYYLLIILFSFSSMLALGQGYDTTKWKFSNPKQFGFTLQDVDFFDNNNVIAVGSDGGIARSRDGGSNWTYGPFTFVNPANGFLTKPSFSDVHFVTSTIAYAVGNLGCMAKTTDGGLTWTLINTPLSSNARNINAVWFTSPTTGYIGGQWNTPDSIPKLYVTNNGGATWDSMAAPVSNGTTKVGFINNVTYPSIDFPITAKAKEIQRIEFINNNIGYISGGGASNFPGLGIPNITSSTTCAFTGQQTTGSHNASLLWKFDNGTLTDFSISKERLGYTGFPATINCTSKFGTVSQTVQQFRALNIINDSLIVMMSFNNNVVVRVRTGKNDSTLNVNRPGVYEKGKFEILNTGPAGPPPGYPPIPAVQVLLASNPYQMRRTSNGTLIANGNFARMWTSVDTGRNWVESRSLPPGRNYSNNGVWALDIAPNGKFLSMGSLGVVADSIPGGSGWSSNYVTVPLSAGFTKMEFADCNNGVAAGSSTINVTADGGKTWWDRSRPDFASSFYSINGFAYRNSNPAQAYFAVSNGSIYYTTDLNVAPPAVPTLDPVYADGLMQMNDLATVGNDSVWAIGYTSFSVPSASRTSRVYRSFNGGATWSVYSGFSVGSLAQNLTEIEFPTRLIGYAAGNRDTIYKTTDAGVTWNKLPLPTPGVTPQITYKDMIALDANTVFVIGNGFPRKVIFRTTDGGATWTDVSGNIGTLGVGNLNAIVMHDINNGYVMTPGLMCKTTDGGATWTLEVPPTSCLFETAAFAPKTVPASIPFANRKLFVTGVNVSGAPIMEFGNPANIAVNSTETVVNASCTNLTGGSITVNATGAIAPYMYSINGGTFQSSNTFTGLTQGPKTITIKDSYCGLLTKTINVGFNDNLVLTTNNDTLVCAGAPVPILASTNGTGTTYAWSPAGGLSATNISNPVATVNNSAAYTVTASLNGCVRTKTVNVNIKPNPIISAGPDKTIVDGDEVTLEGSGTATPSSIAWTPNSTLAGANTYTPVAKPNTTTTYTLTVRDNNNCTSTDNMVVNVIPYCLKVMNAFTPNGDGQNDVWIVTNNGGTCTRQVYATVFNRYGNIVFKDDNYQNKWDGTYKGKPVADGTYYYMITYRLINGASITLKGDVTILR